MEYRAAIYRNISRLKRIASEFFEMAGFNGMNPPEPIVRGRYGMARHVYNAVMALLLPAEAATRRLIIAMAREVKVKPPKPRPRPQRRRFIPRLRTTRGEWVASTVQEVVPEARPIHPRFRLLDPRLRLNRPGHPGADRASALSTSRQSRFCRHRYLSRQGRNHVPTIWSTRPGWSDGW